MKTRDNKLKGRHLKVTENEKNEKVLGSQDMRKTKRPKC